MKYNYALKDDTIGLKDIDKKTKEEVESEISTNVILCGRGETIGAYLLDFIDTDKYPLYRYYRECEAKKAVVYLNDKDVFPVTVNGKQCYISDYSKIKLVAFPEHDYSNWHKQHSYSSSANDYNISSEYSSTVNPTPELMDNVLTNVYNELAKMKSDYDKGKLPDSSEHFEEALKQLQRLKLWG